MNRLPVLSHAEVMRRVQGACDELVARATERHVPPVSCRTGCDHCCKQPVFVTPLEAVAIRDYVKRHGLRAKVRRGIARYRREIAARRDAAQGFAALLRVMRGQGPAPSERGRRAVFGIHCPFLENHTCMIYPARPLMCREHVSFDDPRKCARDEPFLGLDKPRFSEVSAYLTLKTVPIRDSVWPVTDYEEAAETLRGALDIRVAELRKALRWKTGR